MKTFGEESTGDGEFYNPTSVRMDDKGRVVVTEYGNSRIQALKDGKPVFNLEIAAQKNWTILSVVFITKPCSLYLIKTTIV